MITTLNEAAKYVLKCLANHIVPMLVGSPGLGKSALAHQIAKANNLKLIDLRLSQCDPNDLMGFPVVSEGKASYAPFEMFPLESDPIPEGFNGWLLLLDEINAARSAVQVAAYKVALDKMVGQHKLHPNCYVMAAGNKATDHAVVNELSTAMQSRLAHFEIEVCAKTWKKWAANNDIDPRIIAYINFQPHHLHKFTPDHDDMTFACPRTWEFVSKLTADIETFTREDLPLLTGVIGEGVGREYYQFTKCFEKLPTLEEILENPREAIIPQEPSELFAVSGMTGYHLNRENCSTILKYIKRMPSEFEIVCLQTAIDRDQSFIEHPELATWITDHLDHLYF